MKDINAEMSPRKKYRTFKKETLKMKHSSKHAKVPLQNLKTGVGNQQQRIRNI